MTTTTAEKIAVMQAHSDGASIQYCSHDEIWREARTHVWNWRDVSYRVKPIEPVEIYCIREGGFHYRVYSSFQAAKEGLRDSCFNDSSTVVKFREVLGDE